MSQLFPNSESMSEISDNQPLLTEFTQVTFDFPELPEKGDVRERETERSEAKMDLHTLAGVIIPFLPITEKTRYTYTWSFKRHFDGELGRRDVNEISRQDIERIISPLPKQSGYQALMVIRTLFREAHERGWVDINPTKGIKAPKIRTGHQPFLTWEEVRDGFFWKLRQPHPLPGITWFALG